MYFGPTMGYQSVIFAMSSLGVFCCPCHHLVVLVIIVATLHITCWLQKHCTQGSQAVLKTIREEAFDFNKSTHDSHAVIDAQLGLSQKLIYLFTNYLLHCNSRLNIIISLLFLSLIKGHHCCHKGRQCSHEGSSQGGNKS